MALSILSFEGDKSYDKRLKEASNYTDNSHIYTITYGVTQMILAALSPLVLDGHKRLTIKLNVESAMEGTAGYNCDRYFKISYFNLDQETSASFYQFKQFDIAFQRYVATLLLDILEAIDQENGGKDCISERRKAVMEELEQCGFQKEILLPKFSKQTKNRKYKALVYRCFSQKIGEAIRVDMIKGSSGETIASQWMTPIPGYINRVDMIQKAYWEENRFYLLFARNASGKSRTDTKIIDISQDASYTT